MADLHAVVERWIWPAEVVTIAIPSKKSNVNSHLEKVPMFSDVLRCETSMRLLQGVLVPSTVAMKRITMGWMHDDLTPLSEVEDAAVDETVTEDVGIYSTKRRFFVTNKV